MPTRKNNAKELNLELLKKEKTSRILPIPYIRRSRTKPMFNASAIVLNKDLASNIKRLQIQVKYTSKEKLTAFKIEKREKTWQIMLT